MMMPSAVWRPDDEALLARLENEDLLVRLWNELAPSGAPPPHPRAAGMLHLLRESSQGERAAAAALDGDWKPLRALLHAPSLAGQRPELLHHLALFFDALATAHRKGERAIDAHVRSTAAWLALAAQGTYLAGLANSVAGEDLSDEERTEAVERVPTASLERLAAEGQSVAGDCGPEAELALRTFAAIDDAVRVSGCSGRVIDHAKERAVRLRTELIDVTVGALTEAFDDAGTQAPGEAHFLLFERGAQTWKWALQDVDLETFLIDRALPIGWELYHAKKWHSLRRVGEALRGAVDSLARRIESDDAMFPYAARCAQMLVFRAETQPRFEDQLRSAERAVALCDTHRNGRLVLADLLAERAIRTLQGAGWQRTNALQRARADIDRAKELWPQGAKIITAEDAYKRAGGRA
ncbi:MAG: hypothetical protein AAGE52_11505 [Myxococcota bacterium]